MKKRILIIIAVLLTYFFIYSAYLLMETPKTSANFELTEYFTAQKILAGKKFYNERVLFNLIFKTIFIACVIIIYKTKLGKSIYNFFTKKIKYSFLRNFLHGFTIVFLTGIILLPINIISYLHLKYYKIIVTPLGLFFKDFFLGKLLYSIGFALIITLVLFIYKKWKKHFSLITTSIVFIFAVIMMVIYPIFITPLFNTYKKLNNPKLEAQIRALCKKDGINISRLYVMDASKRTRGGNAYVSGIGPTKEIVIYDTLLKDYTKREILSILAHEMGHYKKHHIWVGLLVMPVSNPLMLFAFFAFIALFLDKRKKRHEDSSYQIPILFLIIVIAIWVAMPIINGASRRMERDADLHSLTLTRDSDAFISAEVKLASKHSYGYYDPPWFYKFLYYTHPPVKYRIGMGLSFKNRNDVPSTSTSSSNIRGRAKAVPMTLD